MVTKHIEFLGAKIGQGKISLQPHIENKIIDFSDKIEDTKLLRAFLELLNYVRPYLKDIEKIRTLYNKTSAKGKKNK